MARWDPPQWPPHHISRWYLKDFPRLAQESGLELMECGGDVLFGSGIEERWKLDNRLRDVLGKPRRPGGNFLPGLISFLYRKTGMRFVFPRKGTSIYAYFKNTA